ncbi:2570_t:CDS:2 [Acaulospora morrowiae]|uniref:2570_t:CDS:1 n=1 Tax=Acaulospora morrowiae TaxID=94023 RepID=A0A9N8YQB7_9GLOM|nr:2570_t:CDS:2 [Acaulospora morrowiae]
MASRLPAEVLCPIFQEIYNSRPKSRPHEQYRDLFSCLMVNRFWCRNVISYIWSSVFTPHSPVRYGAIDKYISCLSPSKLEVLTYAGVQLTNVPSTPPIFDYPAFLKSLRFEIFLRDVFDWCHEHDSSQYHDLVIKALIELFAERGARLETFEMKFVDKKAFPGYREKLERLNLNFICEDRFRSLFCNIKKLWLGKDAIESTGLAERISWICNNVEYMTLDFTRSSTWFNVFSIPKRYNISSLIRSQTALQSFVLINYSDGTPDFIFSLPTQSHSLRNIYFCQVYFRHFPPLSFVSECGNLESLTFRDCFDITPELVEPLLLNTWTKLEYVYVTPSFHHSELYYRGQMRTCESLERWANEFSNKGKLWENNSVHLS